MAAAAVVATPHQPDIQYHPDFQKYQSRVKRRLETEAVTTHLPDGFPRQLNSDLVWEGATIGESYDWNFVLTAEHVEELEAALRHFKALNKPLGYIDQTTFPLPKLHSALRDVSRELHFGHGFKVVRGIPVDRHSREENIILYVGLSAHIAPLRARQDSKYNGEPADVVLSHIKDLSTVEDKSTIGAPAYTADKQVFHTDSSDIVSLFCLSPAAEGGESRLASAWRVYNELAATRPDLIETLSHDWIADNFGNSEQPFISKPLLYYQAATDHTPERVVLQYARRYFTGFGALPRSASIPPISEAQAEALDALHFLGERFNVGLNFQKGDIQYVNNLAVFHARDGFTNTQGQHESGITMVTLRWRKSADSGESGNIDNHNRNATTFIQNGGLQYAVEKGENSNDEPSYQEVSGAPVESRSTLGYHVGSITIVFLNLSKMVGTGVYSTPASILTGTGSVGLALIYWFIGFLIAASSLSVYLEYASYFPNRSGSEVVYLEQAFPRPQYLFPITFAVQSVLLSFSASNAIVLARYLYRINGATPTNWQLKGVAVAGYTIAFLFVAFSTRFSYFASNAIGFIKLLTLIFVALTGLVVLGGNVSRVPDPHVNFRNAFSGFGTTHASAYGATNALVKIIFSYAGYENAFNVVNEVKNPVRSIRNSGGLSLLLVAILYVLANVAYFSAVPKEELAESSQVAASLFFQQVFGSSEAVRGLNFLIALSAFGNLLAVLLGSSRLLRECGRQGTLPFPAFWVSTRPFGTPLGPYTVKWGLTMLMILAPPAGDAFNFVVDLASYPSAFFNFLLAIGIYFVRYRRKRLNIPEPSKRYRFQAWQVAVAFTVLVNLYMLIMPWYPPSTGRYGGDVSFWYATYAVTGIGILVACGIYYALWIYVLPRWGGYRIRHHKVVLDGGEVTHELVKVPLDRLETWDQTHDAQGRDLNDLDDGDAEVVDVHHELESSGFTKS
ncbi:hypothetical protein DV737_g4504, partial [Chaetothyriales sp. CBS 132003]